VIVFESPQGQSTIGTLNSYTKYYKVSRYFESMTSEILEPNLEDRIWKYMDFTKFVLLLKNGLWFSRVDLLEDKFEGKLSSMSGYLNGIHPGQSKEYDNNVVKSSRNSYEINRKWYVVNCWNLNKYESIALWSLYVKGECGVAIQSTYDKLKNAIYENKDTTRISGKVKYNERKSDKIDLSPMVLPAFHKDFIFRHEEEIRFLIHTRKRTQTMDDDPGSPGRYICVNLNEIIERVVIAPKLSNWKFDLVKQLMYENKIEKPVQKSSYDNDSY
jgi:hypothetical protein